MLKIQFHIYTSIEVFWCYFRRYSVVLSKNCRTNLSKSASAIKAEYLWFFQKLNVLNHWNARIDIYNKQY